MGGGRASAALYRTGSGVDDAGVDPAPPSIESPDGVGIDQGSNDERNCVGHAEGAMTSPQRRSAVGDARRHGYGFAAVDEVACGVELRTPRCGWANQDLRARGGSKDELGISRGRKRHGRSAVMHVVGGKRGDPDARIENDQPRQPERSSSRYSGG